MTLSQSLSNERLNELLEEVKAHGADSADILYSSGLSVTYRTRNQEIEQVDRAEGAEIGLRVFKGKKQVVVSSGDVSSEALKKLVIRAMDMVRVVPEDPFCGLAARAEWGTPLDVLETFDTKQDDDRVLLQRARECEEAALSVLGVSASEGAEASYGCGHSVWMNTEGFYGHTQDTMRSLSISVLASDAGGMERDYAGSQSIFAQDLESSSFLGQLAGKRTVRRLGGRRIPSGRMPIVFDPRESHSLLGHLASAINGATIARGVSFLKDKMGQSLFPSCINIYDDPHRPRGLRSRSFDAEGISTRPSSIVQDGHLKSWILDLRSARQLGMTTTGHAVRSPSSIPHPSVSNFYMGAGLQTPTQLIGSIKKGFYVTELIGDGVNVTTGDYSRGATGFMIENGVLTYPVHEVTIAGNLCDMFAQMVVADDLVFQYGIDAPTVMIEEMTVAGDG